MASRYRHDGRDDLCVLFASPCWLWRCPAGRPSCCAVHFLPSTSFFAANLHKFGDGGLAAAALALGLLAVMYTWKLGRNEIQEKVYNVAVTSSNCQRAKSKNIIRVPGSAVFMVATAQGHALALLHHLKANKCLSKRSCCSRS